MECKLLENDDSTVFSHVESAITFAFEHGTLQSLIRAHATSRPRGRAPLSASRQRRHGFRKAGSSDSNNTPLSSTETDSMRDTTPSPADSTASSLADTQSPRPLL